MQEIATLCMIWWNFQPTSGTFINQIFHTQVPANRAYNTGKSDCRTKSVAQVMYYVNNVSVKRLRKNTLVWVINPFVSRARITSTSFAADFVATRDSSIRTSVQLANTLVSDLTVLNLRPMSILLRNHQNSSSHRRFNAPRLVERSIQAHTTASRWGGGILRRPQRWLASPSPSPSSLLRSGDLTIVALETMPATCL